MDLQPPLLPGGSQQGNPWFTVANQFVPRNLHDVIRWARYISIQSPTTSEVIRKLATYPITDFIVDTDEAELKNRYDSVFKSFKLKEALQDSGFEFFTIGNVFLSIYFPVHRELVCPTCKTSYSAKKAGWLKFQQYQFVGECRNPLCGYKGAFTRVDTKSVSIEDMNLIKWTPEHIAVNHNPITGESEYYYKIPNTIKTKIQKGDRLFVDSIPWGFVEATRHNQDFKFDRGSLFHLKNISSGGTVEGIAVPPLLSLFSLVFYQATLRKANEAIAMEHLNPLRVVFPQAQTANSDPVVSMSLRNFRSNMEDALKRHKNDKAHVVIAPTPVGYASLGGDGKNLLVAQEIQQAEETILLSLGVSRELLSGITNWTSSSVGLRMMENLLTSYIGRLQDLIDWILDRVTGYLSMKRVDVSLIPFKLLDDDNFKNLLSQLVQTGTVSQRTFFEEIGIDYHDEQERLKEEAGLRAAHDIETQYEADIAHFVAAKGAGKVMEDNEEYVNLLREATMYANQIGQSTGPDGSNVALDQLRLENYTMYLLVKRIMGENMASAVEQQQLEPEGAPGKPGDPAKKAGGAGKPPADAKAPAKMNDFAPPKGQ
jgi:hypothetical protein